MVVFPIPVARFSANAAGTGHFGSGRRESGPSHAPPPRDFRVLIYRGETGGDTPRLKADQRRRPIVFFSRVSHRERMRPTRFPSASRSPLSPSSFVTMNEDTLRPSHLARGVPNRAGSRRRFATRCKSVACIRLRFEGRSAQLVEAHIYVAIILKSYKTVCPKRRGFRAQEVGAGVSMNVR